MKVNIPALRRSMYYRLHTVFIVGYLTFNIWFNRKLEPTVSAMNVFLYAIIALSVIYGLVVIYYLITLRKLWIWGVLLLIGAYFLMAKYAHLMLYEVLPNHGHEAFHQISRSVREFLFMNAPRFFYYSCISLFFVFQYRNGKNMERAAQSEKEEAEAKEQAILAELAKVEAEKNELVAANKADDMELRAWNAYTDPHFLQNELRSSALMAAEATDDKKRAALEKRLNRIADITGYNSRNVFNDRRVVVFEREWKQLRNYLESRDVGSEGYQHPVVELVGEPMGHKIVPMTLVYLAEGAFKHGDLFSEPLYINIALYDDRVELLFRNRLPAAPRQVDSLGSGLTVIKRRLELAMPRKSTWESGPKGNHFEVRILIYQIP